MDPFQAADARAKYMIAIERLRETNKAREDTDQ